MRDVLRRKKAGLIFGRDERRFKKGASSQPDPIDPAASAAAQSGLNKEAVFESARVNQINQRSPFGDISFSGEIGEPDRTQTLTLPPEVQAILDRQNDVAGSLTDFAADFVPRISASLSEPFNTDSIGPAPVADAAERQRQEENLFARLDPHLQRDQEALENQLANQGVARGSEAFKNALGDFSGIKNDARLAAINQAGNEYARDFGLQTQSHNQQIADALLNRTQGLNEVSALLQGAPAIQTPTVPQPSQFQVAPGDFQGAQALQAQLAQNAANSRTGAQSSMFGGLAGLGGSLGSAGIMSSDRRLKTDIKRVGEMEDGTPIYTYKYVWGGPIQMGVMAQDIAKTNPSAVHQIDGHLAVDYGAL